MKYQPGHALQKRLFSFCCCACTLHAAGDPYEVIARRLGWWEDLRHGREIVHKLAALKSRDSKKLKIDAYRGEHVDLVGWAAPPGGTNDLVTEDGYYLRIINASDKDLRPLATVWQVMVRGTIGQVLPENKIIYLEMDDKDWQLVEMD